MKRRVCESCLYFESAGFSKNGWCHHPGRRANTDVRLMVRSNELNCRNGWNADLWVAASNDAEAHPVHLLDPIARRARSEIEPAEQNDLITSIVAAKTDNIALPEDRPVQPPMVRPFVEEDIFLKQTPSLTWSTGPISNQPATELVQNPKAAILRARDQFRARRKNEGRIADQQVLPPSAPLVASAREAQLVHDHDLAEPDPAPEAFDPRYENRPLVRPVIPASSEDRRPVSPVRRVEIDRPFPLMTDFPEDRVRFESVPSMESEPLVRLHQESQDDTWLETRQIDTVPPAPYEVDELFDEDEIVTYAEADLDEEEELSVQHRESILNRYLRQRRERQFATEYVEYDDEPEAADRSYLEQPSIAAETRLSRVTPNDETRQLAPGPSESYAADVRESVEPFEYPLERAAYQAERLAAEPVHEARTEAPPYRADDTRYEPMISMTMEDEAASAYEDDDFFDRAPVEVPPPTMWNRRDVEQSREIAAAAEVDTYLDYQEYQPSRQTETYREPESYRISRPVREVSQPPPRPTPRRYVEPAAEIDDDFIIPPPLPEYQPRQHAEPQSPPRPRPRIELTAPVRRPEVRPETTFIADEFGDQPLFSSQPIPPMDDYQVDPPHGTGAQASYPAARMERICQSCRDFRPSDTGERGWCNNKWAFNHRRMVDADDLACRNSLGSWWTPKDDVWRRDGDISRHAQQTPRVDQWLLGSNSDVDDRRKSGS